MRHKEERMSNEFTKHLLDFEGKTPFHMVVHHFTDTDKGGPHDHPFRFTTHILKGGYTERIYRIITEKETGKRKWQYKDIFRAPGTSHVVEAECIHEIIDLPEGECWTVMIPEPKTRDSGFWRFNEEGAFHRKWFEKEFIKVNG